MTAGCGQTAVWVDGEFLTGEAPVFTALDAAPRSGAGLFETLRAQRSGNPTLGLHLERLRASAERLGYRALPELDYEDVLRALLARAGLEAARFRLSFFPPDSGVRLVASVEPLPAGSDRGIVLRVSPYRRGRNDPTAAHKLVSRAFLDLARREAELCGGDDAMLLGEDGEVLETTRANLFLVAGDGTLVTPAPNGSFLEGITRARLLAAARSSGVPVEERRVRVDEIHDASELFVTNAIVGVAAVKEVDGDRFACPGQLERWSGLLERDN
ncbi:MAG: aminotransferase class IV [Planctomycetota bacterium]